MSSATKTRSGRKTRRGPSEATQGRQAEVELAAAAVDGEAPDYIAFLNRWGKRYSETNLNRLWIQRPNATAIHKFGTWRGMGRAVRRGESAIWLRIPHTSHDDDKVTEDNPTGEVFSGAPWMALFDYSQTDALGEFDDAAPGATDDDLAEIKRLRMAAADLHPDRTGQDTAPQFMAAWQRYLTFKARFTTQDQETRS